jgi:predicted DNA-binding transcriptional regulator AlpA
MNKILKHYTMTEIIKLCGISKGTAYNWRNKNNMPMWAIERLGFGLVKSGESV